jgi:hypothetical protein
MFLLACAPYQPTPSSDPLKGVNKGVYVELCEKQAPVEFDCPLQDMKYKQAGNDLRIQAEGCGKKAIYVWVDGARWVLNSAISPTGE